MSVAVSLYPRQRRGHWQPVAKLSDFEYVFPWMMARRRDADKVVELLAALVEYTGYELNDHKRDFDVLAENTRFLANCPPMDTLYANIESEDDFELYALLDSAALMVTAFGAAKAGMSLRQGLQQSAVNVLADAELVEQS